MRTAHVLDAPFLTTGNSALPAYLETVMLVERMHRELLETVKAELERLGRSDATAVQALMLFYLADREMTAGELGTRGLYQGSNVSYNLKKLIEGGYVHHRRCAADRRAVRLRLSSKGAEIHAIVARLFQRQADAIADTNDTRGLPLGILNEGLRLVREGQSAAATQGF
ncbi:MAG: MarR family transcriptional regulator [Pseudomonadota bacterium]